MSTYAISGDLGDLIYSLRICFEVNDPNSTYFLVDRPFTKAWTQPRLNALVPLVEAQPYIGRAIHGEYLSEPSHDFTDFRRGGHPYLVNLPDMMADWLGINTPLPYRPWLTAPNPIPSTRPIFHRSPRYHNPLFPLEQVFERFNPVCVGLPSEHKLVEEELGRCVDFMETDNYLDLANRIAGCPLFIGNQSSPAAIAIGLGIPTILETCDWVPDCIYTNAPVCYSFYGGFTLNGKQTGQPPFTFHLDTTTLPPGGWKWFDRENNIELKSRDTLSQFVRKLDKMGSKVSKEWVSSYTTISLYKQGRLKLDKLESIHTHLVASGHNNQSLTSRDNSL